jgi:hypothetical protein
VALLAVQDDLGRDQHDADVDEDQGLEQPLQFADGSHLAGHDPAEQDVAEHDGEGAEGARRQPREGDREHDEPFGTLPLTAVSIRVSSGMIVLRRATLSTG